MGCFYITHAQSYLLGIIWFNFDAAGEITGKGRIPYGDLSKLGCVVTGLPQGLEFKQPKQYSSSELRRLLDSMDKIKFLEIPDFSGERKKQLKKNSQSKSS